MLALQLTVAWTLFMVVLSSLTCDWSCTATHISRQVNGTANAVDSVIIYGSNVAKATRRVVIEDPLPAGTHTISLSGLTNRLDMRSVEISGIGPAEVLDVKIAEVKPAAEVNNEALMELTAQLDELTQIKESINRKAISHTIRKGTFQRYTDGLLADVTTSFKTVDEAMAFLAIQESKLLALDEETDQLKSQLQEIEKNVTALQAQRQDIQQAALTQRTYKAVTFQFRLLEAVTKPITFDISYFSSLASWRAEYDLRIGKALAVSPGKYDIEVAYFASVSQATGENWDNTSLALTTSIPSQAASLPTLKARAVGYPVIAKPTINNVLNQFNNFHNSDPTATPSATPTATPSATPTATPSATPTAIPTADRRPEPTPVVSVVSAESYSSGDISTSNTFQLSYRVNMTESLGQNERHRLLIDKYSFPARIFTYAVPSSKTGAFLRVWGKLPDNVSTTLLDGPSTRVFFEDTFTGTTNLKALQTGGDLRVNLGEDRNTDVSIAEIVAKDNKHVEDKSTWFVTDKEKFRVKTEEAVLSARSVRPAGSTDSLLVLAEQVPVSTDEEIKVKLMSPSDQDVKLSHEAAVAALTEDMKLSLDPRVKTFIAALSPSSTAHGDEFLDAVVYAATALRASRVTDSKSAAFVFKCSVTSTLYWSKWLTAGETFSTALKYQYIWPDEKGQDIVVK